MIGIRDRRSNAWVFIFAVSMMSFALQAGSSGQERVSHGEDIVPTFEGWEEVPDGTFNMVFGYLNRNYDEVLNVPIGPDNNLAGC